MKDFAMNQGDYKNQHKFRVNTILTSLSLSIESFIKFLNYIWLYSKGKEVSQEA